MEMAQQALDRRQIVDVILSSLADLLDTAAEGEAPVLDEQTRLVGRSAVLDSMGLVTLVVEVEQRLESDYDAVVVLADDRAMSQSRSPFLSVGSLADYVVQLLAEQAQ